MRFCLKKIDHFYLTVIKYFSDVKNINYINYIKSILSLVFYSSLPQVPNMSIVKEERVDRGPLKINEPIKYFFKLPPANHHTRCEVHHSIDM